MYPEWSNNEVLNKTDNVSLCVIVWYPALCFMDYILNHDQIVFLKFDIFRTI